MRLHEVRTDIPSLISDHISTAEAAVSAPHYYRLSEKAAADMGVHVHVHFFMHKTEMQERVIERLQFVQTEENSS